MHIWENHLKMISKAFKANIATNESLKLKLPLTTTICWMRIALCSLLASQQTWKAHKQQYQEQSCVSAQSNSTPEASQKTLGRISDLDPKGWTSCSAAVNLCWPCRYLLSGDRDEETISGFFISFPSVRMIVTHCPNKLPHKNIRPTRGMVMSQK